MTVLQALVGHYDRLAESDPALHYGYSSQGVSYAVVLSPEGEIVDVMDIRDTTGKSPRTNRIMVPGPVNRSVNVAPNFLWDKTAYSLGLVRDEATGEPTLSHRGEHDAFKQLHLDLLAATDDKGLGALVSFLTAWNPDPEQFAQLTHARDMFDANVVFRLDGEREYIHDRTAGRRIWQDHLATQGGAEALCLVTGELAPVERLHPKIKGVRGAQSSGASIVSFNLERIRVVRKKAGSQRAHLRAGGLRLYNRFERHADTEQRTQHQDRRLYRCLLGRSQLGRCGSFGCREHFLNSCGPSPNGCC